MRLHFVGICGTYMSGLANIARQLGFHVTGSDRGCYEPMRSQLAGINISEGYTDTYDKHPADAYIIGNVARRSMPLVESIISSGQQFYSGPDWLARNVLGDRSVISIAGTHGKTTTTAMLIHILSKQGMQPSYLLGGVPTAGGRSSQLTESKFFIIEADEYDSAFFDKRPKFTNYWPEVAVLTNVEFDHADVYRDMEEVLLQFGRFARTVKPKGTLIVNGSCENSMRAVGEAEKWCNLDQFAVLQNKGWNFSEDGVLRCRGQEHGKSEKLPPGKHNRFNMLAAIAAAVKLGCTAKSALISMGDFQFPLRRMEEVARGGGIILIDDFAHHPTEIEATLAAAAERYPEQRIVVLLEIGSHTMRSGHWRERLGPSLEGAAKTMVLAEHVDWDVDKALAGKAEVFPDPDKFMQAVASQAKENDLLLMMSNGDFGGKRIALADAVRSLGGGDEDEGSEDKGDNAGEDDDIVYPVRE